MSRLPRLHSSPDRELYSAQIMGPSSSSTASTTLKRKALTEEEELEATDQPRKLPAIGTGGASRPNPLQRSAVGNIPNAVLNPKPLTRPREPVLATSRPTRATSAPPSKPVRSFSGSASTANRPTAAARAPPGRTVSTSRSNGANGTADKRFQDLENQLGALESARAADSARLAAAMEAERAKVSELQANHLAISRELAAARSQELTQRRELVSAGDELESLKKRHAREVVELETDLKKRDRVIRELNEDVRVLRDDVGRERETVSALKSTISQLSTAQLSVTTQKEALQAQIGALQALLDESTRANAQLRLTLESTGKKCEDLEREAREAEGVRRKLHNMVQELKGNIRVFCRVRPVLPSDLASGAGEEPPEEQEKLRETVQASIAFPDKRDHKEIVLSSSSESAMGQERKEVYNFGFDRVFDPGSSQLEVFEEVSQLAQSCTDGYNVCIFAYGQTGSGKSFTMEGGPTDATSGMIPRAVEQVFRVTEELKPKGWEYKMEGQFLEIYNETINDLLGKGEFDRKKHEIKHDSKSGTRVTDVNVVPLHSSGQVRNLLTLAQSRRSVAATLMNERSSRSHSVFTLRISGANGQSGETCEGSLNLVDLAGSERLNASGAGSDKERLKETQSINKSLSALGDVIAALGEKEKGEKHIPYRNSKLTYLLQNSLSGNSKTLMVLNISPLAAHLNETLTSLRFATKVNSTTIGTAKKQTKAL